MNNIFIFLITMICITSCNMDSFLTTEPKGTIYKDQLNTPDNAEKMVVAAYSAQGNESYQYRPLTPWVYGDLRSGDCYKGGAGVGDRPLWHNHEVFSLMSTENGGVEGKWIIEYQAIARANLALGVLQEIDDNAMPTKLMRTAEMRFLRANNYFWLKVNFKHVPFIDENVPLDDYTKIDNNLSDAELWHKIIEDFRFAEEHLPAFHSDGAVGRPNKFAAKAYLAKALLFSAYEQNESHEVININQEVLNEVVSLCRDVLENSGKDLFQDFGDNFTCEGQNGVESLWAIQFSHDDGTPRGRVNGTTMTTYPMVEEYGCCGYQSPSQNLVNSFRTENGLPVFDSFNEIDIIDHNDVVGNSIDPRLLHTVAIDGLPFKYKSDFIYNARTWTRNFEVYGGFLSMKQTVIYDSPCYTPVNPWKDSSKNRDVIRIADVMLWLAEALIQTGRHNEALPLINKIRLRASTSVNKLVDSVGMPTGNFKVEPYIVDGIDKNCDWTKEFAFKALQFERRLEFACEGFRAYDLMRWGIMAETLNEYFEKEKTKRAHLSSAYFLKGRDEFLPIPQREIDLSKDLYRQNNGY